MTRTGLFIRDSRKSRDMSGKHLANLLGMSPQYLCDIELGRRMPSASMAQKVAQILDVSDQQMARLWSSDNLPDGWAVISEGSLSAHDRRELIELIERDEQEWEQLLTDPLDRTYRSIAVDAMWSWLRGRAHDGM